MGRAHGRRAYQNARPYSTNYVRSILAGRQPRSHWKPGQHGEALGCLDRKGKPFAARAHAGGHVCELLAGRAECSYFQPRWHGYHLARQRLAERCKGRSYAAEPSAVAISKLELLSH